MRRAAATLAIAFGLGFAAAASADPTFGYLEDWSSAGLSGWNGGAQYANPGTGGVGGAGDGFLQMSTPTLGRLVTFSTTAPYLGNWQAAGITRIVLWLNDVNTDETLEIHVAVGNAANLWLYNPGFSPPEHQWERFVVDVSSASAFTQIIGTGTFDQALQNVDRVQIRHDVAPFVQAADSIIGDVGIDRVELTDVSVPIVAGTWGRLKSLYR